MTTNITAALITQGQLKAYANSTEVIRKGAFLDLQGGVQKLSKKYEKRADSMHCYCTKVESVEKKGTKMLGSGAKLGGIRHAGYLYVLLPESAVVSLPPPKTRKNAPPTLPPTTVPTAPVLPQMNPFFAPISDELAARKRKLEEEESEQQKKRVKLNLLTSELETLQEQLRTTQNQIDVVLENIKDLI
jgi:uncharacterized protein YlxW (UPF0749 family)